MVEPRDEWHRFPNDEERLAYLKENGIIPKKAESAEGILYAGAFTAEPVPCAVQGYTETGAAVIEITGELHCINPAYLAEMQPKKVRVKKPSAAEASFVVIDTETTGTSIHKDSIVEIAALRYEGRKETGSFVTLVCPDCKISRGAQAVHHITPEMVAGKPKFSEIAPAFLDFIGDSVLVGHNISFDTGIINESLFSAFLGQLNNPTMDTMQLAKKVLPDCENYQLGTLVDLLGIESTPTHRAEDDCRATAQLLFRLQDIQSGASAYQPKQTQTVKPPAQKKKAAGFQQFETVKLSEIQPQYMIVDTTHPFYGKSIVFTGEFQMPKQDVMQAVVNLGGVLKSGVSTKTDYLIVGTNESKSGKERKAEELNQSGKGSITLVREEQLLTMLEDADRYVNKEEPYATEGVTDALKLSETELFEALKPALLAAMAGYGIPSEKLTLVQMSGYWSVFLYDRCLLCRLKSGQSFTYLTVKRLPLQQKDLLDGVVIKNTASDEQGGFDRIILTDDALKRVQNIAPTLVANAINAMPKAYDCCSRYEECSDAKHCIHPDPVFAAGCGYARILREGRIFYGKNRNID